MHERAGMEDVKKPPFFLKGGPATAPLALTALRVGFGIVMAAHGWAKLGNVSAWQAQVASLGIPAPDLAAWLAIAGELAGGVGLIVGFLTPIAAFGVFATMVTAIVTVHWGNGLLAKNNGFELPLTMALLAAYFISRGAGPLSLDALMERAPGTSDIDANRGQGSEPREPEPAI